MQNGYSVEDLLAFLSHAADKGLMPSATAQALAVASRNIFGVLDAKERADLREVDLDEVTKRFVTKRARDFSPSSLKEYGNRVVRAVSMFLRWMEDPTTFSVKTRNTSASAKREKQSPAPNVVKEPDGTAGYETSVPVRSGVVVTITNLPEDLTKAEAERLSTFIKMLAV